MGVHGSCSYDGIAFTSPLNRSQSGLWLSLCAGGENRVQLSGEYCFKKRSRIFSIGFTRENKSSPFLRYGEQLRIFFLNGSIIYIEEIAQIEWVWLSDILVFMYFFFD